MQQSVTLLYWGERRRTELVALLAQERRPNIVKSAVELAKGGQSADVLLVDVPTLIRRSTCEQARRHHRGRLIVLLDPGDSSLDLPPDHNRTLLTRPLSVQELSAALAGSAPLQPPSDPTDDPRTVLARSAQAHETTARLGSEERSLVAHVVPRLARSWREHRLVRLSAISLIAALAFMVAFALANRDAACGADCDELTGADLASPSTTITPVMAGLDMHASSTTMAGPTTTDPSGGLTADAASRADGDTSDTPQMAGTTVGSSGAPSPTPPPAPTRPQVTAAPTTSAPTTTSSRTTTSATTPTTTSTTAAIGP